MTNDNLGNQHFAQDQCEQNNISGGQQTIYRNVENTLGSGKSVLLSCIIRSVQQKVESTPKLAVVYFYFSYGDVEQPPIFQLWACLLQQLLEQSAPGGIASSLQSRFESSPYGDNFIRPNEHINLFIEQCSMFKTVYIIIDALDVYLTHQCDKTQDTIYESFTKLPSNVRVLFSSRNGALARRLCVQNRFDVVPKTADIEAYVKSRVQDISHLRKLQGNDERSFMVEIIRQTKTSQMYTDASLCTLKDMLNGLAIDKNDLTKAFKPSFDRIMGSKPSDQSLARHILTWAIHSKQDLTHALLLEMLEFSKKRNDDHKEWHLDADSLLHVCCGLIILDHKNGTFRLIHDSIRKCESMVELRLSQLEAEIARVCLECLVSQNTDNNGLLLSYSASFWALHLRSMFLLNTAKVTRALGLVPITDPGHLGKYDIYIDEVSADGKTALHWALLALGAKPNIQDASNETPLHKLPRGSTDKCLDIARVLINHEADVTLQSKGQSPLSLAIQYGPTSLARLFIESQKDLFYHGYHIGTWLRDQGEGSGQRVRLNEPTTDGWLPLPAALLSHQPNPADSNLRDGQSGQTPLRSAITYNRQKEARLLLQHGSDVNEINEDGWKPLIHLCEWEDHELARTVIEKGARLDEIDIKNNNKDITWLLTTKGANVNIPGPKSMQNIEQALQHNDYSIAWLLCEHGAAVEGRDEKGMALLHRASRKGNLRQVQFLMDRGLTLSTGDEDGKTPLHHALLASRNTGTKILDKPDHNGTTALILATLKMNFPMGMAPIHFAAQLGWIEGLRIFTQQVKDINMSDNMGNTAVHRAVYGDRIDVIRYLASEKASLEILNNSGCSPLMAAAGANVYRKGKNGCSAIDFASYRGTSKSMKIFQTVLKLPWSQNGNDGS
ncbi:ankyrin repeat-containing domain protein [Fusarium avenaceum]|nr:ankyrin repeat-containing domain protein [Fusarium avenaceum]